jgi:tetratricopeptide (TPR) repeat protein
LLGNVLATIASDLAIGPTPVAEALVRVQEILQGAGGDPRLTVWVGKCAGLLLAMLGRVREGLVAEAHGDAILRKLGVDVDRAITAQTAGPLLRLVGQFDQAEQLLLEADAILERSSDRGIRSAEQGLRSTMLARLARVLVEQGRHDDAERTALRAIEISESDDFMTLLHAHGALSKVLANRGDTEAEAEARLAIALAESTDMLWHRGEAWEHLGEALLAEGRGDEANTAFRTALDRFERKGATALADRICARLEQSNSEARAGRDRDCRPGPIVP